MTARFLVKQFKYAILIIFIIAAVITPDRRSDDPGDLRRADARPLRASASLIAWIVGPKRLDRTAEATPTNELDLRLLTH